MIKVGYQTLKNLHYPVNYIDLTLYKAETENHKNKLKF